MKFIDLFCGIGGFRIGLENAGGTCVFSSDIDKFARQTYKHNFGEEPAGDITQIDAKDIPAHDILCAGLPCQSFSVAGQKRGLDDPRGRMFLEIVRIAQHHKPAVLFLENVPHLLHHDNGNTFRNICMALKDIGYNVKHQLYNALEFGLPQNRKRLFIVATLQENPTFSFPHVHDTLTPKVCAFADIKQEHVPPSYYYKPDSKIYITLEPEFNKNPDVIIQWRRGDYHIFKNYTPVLTAGTGGHNICIVKDTIGIRKLTPTECMKLQGFSLLPLDCILDKDVDESYTLSHSAWQSILQRKDVLEKRNAGFGYKLYKPQDLYVGTITSHYSKRGEEILIEQQGKNPRRITPEEAKRLQGFPKSFEFPVSKSQSYKQIGNAVPIPIVHFIAKHIKEYIDHLVFKS